MHLIMALRGLSTSTGEASIKSAMDHRVRSMSNIANGLCCITEDDLAKMDLTICRDVSQKNRNASVNVHVHEGESNQEEGRQVAHLGRKASSAAQSMGLILICAFKIYSKIL